MTRHRTLAEKLASAVVARHNCIASTHEHHKEWIITHAETATKLVADYMPHGSGLDGAMSIDLDASNATKLVFHTSFHHMNDGGMYDGWTDHSITCRPSFLGYCDITISGRDRNGIKDYIGELFHDALSRMIAD